MPFCPNVTFQVRLHPDKVISARAVYPVFHRNKQYPFIAVNEAITFVVWGLCLYYKKKSLFILHFWVYIIQIKILLHTFFSELPFVSLALTPPFLLNPFHVGFKRGGGERHSLLLCTLYFVPLRHQIKLLTVSVQIWRARLISSARLSVPPFYYSSYFFLFQKLFIDIKNIKKEISCNYTDISLLWVKYTRMFVPRFPGIP